MDVSLVVGPLSTWPDSELRRAHRLLVATLRREGPGDPDLLEEIASFGEEIARRQP